MSWATWVNLGCNEEIQPKCQRIGKKGGFTTNSVLICQKLKLKTDCCVLYRQCIKVPELENVIRTEDYIVL